MRKTEETAPRQSRRSRGQYTITVSRADARLVERRLVRLEVGPSEFFQTLIRQGVGARLAVVTDFVVKT